MKVFRKTYLHTVILIAGSSLISCTKSQQVFYPENKVIDVKIRGYIGQDSLQLRLGNKILKPFEDQDAAYFTGTVYTDQVSNGATTLSLLDGKGAVVLERKIDAAQISNTVKFYYDGVNIIDKIPEMPKQTAGNVGLLLNFPERAFSKVPLKDIAIKVNIMRRGKPTLTSMHSFREDGTAFIDIHFPPEYQYFSIFMMNANDPTQKYTPNAMTNQFTLMNPKADKGYLFFIKEAADGNGNFDGIQSVELTQYLN